MPNYTSAARVIAKYKPGGAESLVPTEWLDEADKLIEEYLGHGFKGATRTVRLRSDGTSRLALPGPAASVTSIRENGRTMGETEYELIPGDSWLYYEPYNFDGGLWPNGYTYVVTYVETTQPTGRVRKCADELVGTMLVHSERFSRHGAANSATTSAGAGGGTVSGTLSFPDYQEALAAVLKLNLDTGGLGL